MHLTLPATNQRLLIVICYADRVQIIARGTLDLKNYLLLSFFHCPYRF